MTRFPNVIVPEPLRGHSVPSGTRREVRFRMSTPPTQVGDFVVALFADVVLVNPAIDIELRLAFITEDEFNLYFITTVPERDTAVPTCVEHVVKVNMFELETKLRSIGRIETLRELVFKNVEMMFAHEAGEAFHVRGERVFDPHGHPSNSNRWAP